MEQGPTRRPPQEPARAGEPATPPAGVQEHFDGLLAPVRLEWRLPATADATATATRFGRLGLLSVEAGPVRISRTPRLVALAPGSRVAVAVQRSGTAALTQDGRSTTLHPGDLAFVDVRRPFVLEQRSRFRLLLVAVPARVLGLSADRLGRVTGRAVTQEADGAGHLLVPFLERLPDLAGRVSRAVTDQLVDTTAEFAALLADEVLQDEGPPGSARDRLLPLVRRYIDQHLADPDLTPERVAAAHHISVRYLHRIFEREGTTVGRLIQQRRVEECGRELARRGRAGPTISAVALRWGFRSPAHFSRAFKGVFGLPPRQWRLAGTPPPGRGPEPGVPSLTGVGG